MTRCRSGGKTLWWSRRRHWRSQILRRLHSSISYVICHIHEDGRMKLLQWPSEHHWAVFHDAAGGDDDTFVQVTQMAGWGLLAGWSLFLACLSLFLAGLESFLDGWSLLGWLECVLNLLLNLLPEVGWLCFWLVGPPKGAFIRLIKGPHTVLSRAFSIPLRGLISSFKGLFVRPYPFKELYRVL